MRSAQAGKPPVGNMPFCLAIPPTSGQIATPSAHSSGGSFKRCEPKSSTILCALGYKKDSTARLRSDFQFRRKHVIIRIRHAEMEHSTASAFSDPGEWDRASYEHHPVDNIAPVDTATSGKRLGEIIQRAKTAHRSLYFFSLLFELLG